MSFVREGEKESLHTESLEICKEVSCRLDAKELQDYHEVSHHRFSFLHCPVCWVWDPIKEIAHVETRSKKTNSLWVWGKRSIQSYIRDTGLNLSISLSALSWESPSLHTTVTVPTLQCLKIAVEFPPHLEKLKLVKCPNLRNTLARHLGPSLTHLEIKIHDSEARFRHHLHPLRCVGCRG